MNDRNKSVYSAEEEDKYYRVEDDSWWFQHRADIILEKMWQYFDKSKLTADVGGGNGYTTCKAKESGFNMLLVEPSERACQNALSRGLKTCNNTVSDTFPSDGEWDQVLLLDVMEHIEEVGSFLNNIKRSLGKEGMLLVTVPAFMRLWSSEDDAARHYRRYTNEILRASLDEAGFEVLYSSYFMSFLYYPILLMRVFGEKIGLLKPCWQRTKDEEKKIMDTQFKTKNGMVSLVMNYMRKKELKRLRTGTYNKGSSLIAVAKVRNDK